MRNRKPIAQYSADGKTLIQIDNKLIRKFSINPGVTTIAQRAFAGCENLRYIFGMEDVITIGAEAFAGCKNLIAIELPRVQKIGDGAFMDCEKLLNLYIPKTIKSLGASFIANSGVKVLSLPATLTNTVCRFDDSQLLHIYVYLPEGNNTNDITITFTPESFDNASYPFICMPYGGSQWTINGIVVEDNEDGVTAVIVPNFLRSIPEEIDSLGEFSISVNGKGRNRIIIPNSIEFAAKEVIAGIPSPNPFVFLVPKNRAAVFNNILMSKVEIY